MQDKYLSIITEKLSVSKTEAAKLIGIESPSLDKDRREGHLGIPYIKAGSRVLYSLVDLKEWLNKNKSVPPSKVEA